MKNGLNKFAKGMFAIFTIKLLFFGIIFVNQACSKEDSLNLETSILKDDFLESLKLSKNELDNVKIYSNKSILVNNLNQKISSSNNLEKIDLIKNVNDEININNLNDFANSLNSGQIDYLDENEICDNKDERCMTIFVDPTDIQESLSPALLKAKQILYSKGFTDTEISLMLDGEPEETLIPIVAIGLSNPNSSTVNNIKIENLFFSSAYAQAPNKTVNCFMEATGVSAGLAVVGVFTAKAFDKTKLIKVVKKAAKAIGKRALGFIGLGIIVAEFTWCMNRK